MILDNCYSSFINLDHRIDRRTRMEKTLSDVGIDAERTRGILPSDYKGDPARVSVMQKRTPGAIGCHFSQIAVMEEALKRGKNAMVMEDDLVFCSDFQKRMGIMDEFLTGKAWDVIWLGGTFHVGPPWWHKKGISRDAECTENPNIMRTYGAFSTHAYIVNRYSIAHILNEIDSILHLSMGIDWAFIQLQPKLHTYAFVPGCVIQYDNRSDIGRGVTVFSGFKKLGPYWYQDKMEDFDPLSFDWKEAKV
jgi:GR25 family glycosyltransferase involved in LPS biosynthesis